jgi:hypothetical protein
MSQYPHFEMPTAKAPDVTGSLLDLARMSAASSEMDIRKRELALREADKATATAQTTAIDDAVQTPVPYTTAGARVMASPAQPQVDAADTLPSTQVTGSMALPGSTRAPNRDEVLARVPAHIQPVVRKMYADADEQAQKSVQALRDAHDAALKASRETGDYMGFLGSIVYRAQGDPSVTTEAINHAKETYAQFPELAKRVDAFAAQVTNDPTATTETAKNLMRNSEKYRGELALTGKENDAELAGRAANDPDPQIRAAAQKALDIHASYERDKVLKSPKSLQSENEWQVDGKSTPVIFDPASGARYLTQADIAAHNPIDPSRMRKIQPASASMMTGSVDDVKEAVAGMKDGSLPPQIPGRASKDYTAIMAEAHRQGYELAKANQDWTATQKHISTMNGSQQLRLNQAINSLPDMLDSVDALASQWKGGSFPILNKANLALAKGGAYGKEVASVANQLDSQIADVTSDLGVVYMGGNSPTDHALGLAGKSLNGEWDEKVLHDMVKLAKKNVGIRQNSVKNTGVAGASADNPYAPQRPVSSGVQQEGDVKPIDGYPGTEQTFKNGKWVRTK